MGPDWCLKFTQWCIFIAGSCISHLQGYTTIGLSCLHYMHIREHSALKIPDNFQDIKQGIKNLILYLNKYTSVIGSTIFQNEKFYYLIILN